MLCTALPLPPFSFPSPPALTYAYVPLFSFGTYTQPVTCFPKSRSKSFYPFLKTPLSSEQQSQCQPKYRVSAPPRCMPRSDS